VVDALQQRAMQQVQLEREGARNPIAGATCSLACPEAATAQPVGPAPVPESVCRSLSVNSGGSALSNRSVAEPRGAGAPPFLFSEQSRLCANRKILWEVPPKTTWRRMFAPTGAPRVRWTPRWWSEA
jgi:hypothetical protein